MVIVAFLALTFIIIYCITIGHWLGWRFPPRRRYQQFKKMGGNSPEMVEIELHEGQTDL